MGKGDRAPGKSQFLCSLDTSLNTGVSQWVRIEGLRSGPTPGERTSKVQGCLGGSCRGQTSAYQTVQEFEVLPL